MSERRILVPGGSPARGAIRGSVLFLLALILILGAAAGLRWRDKIASRLGFAPAAGDEHADHQGAPPPEEAAPEGTIYYCPMHPEYTAKQPGDCPICNMRLVPMKTGQDATASAVEGRANVAISAERRQLIGVRTALAERRPVSREIRAVGVVEYDETRLAAVNLKVGGWVEELFVKSTGVEVQAGDPLFSLYSPELIEAQRNYLLARESIPEAEREPPAGPLAPAQRTVQSARDRLLLLDLSAEQIDALETQPEVPRLTTFHSKFDGVVTQRNVVQGAAVKAGTDLYDLADLSVVWVHADVYEYELPLVQVGMPARIQASSQPNETLTGQVIFVYPYLNAATRTARVRIAVPNETRLLKPGMYATVFLAADLGERLVVDDQAVLDTGARRIVFVDQGEGRLEPREVQVGQRSDGQIVIEDGLMAGERIVVSGNFLVDSESRLKAALLGGGREPGAEHAGHGQ
ncbi:MAG: efflux RND transporter periplasmic adaptor subunit [Planctomycetota bacterium]